MAPVQFKSDACFLNVEPHMPSRHVSLSCCSSEGIKQDGRDVVEVNLLFLPSDVTIKSTSKILPSPRRPFICYPSLVPLKCTPVCTLSPCADSKHQLSSNQHPPVTYPAWWTALLPPKPRRLIGRPEGGVSGVGGWASSGGRRAKAERTSTSLRPLIISLSPFCLK